ncbi:uncharacterized protein LOC111033376 isoform X2 [Myzus persicae]|uniref:uncharacterized protein LOC111033376 isoform X2 n=1 Tax=Myzus persicae TaxID=13164 RepID=UPI000B935029|nr:uncharacterized protein LOC111033376 isoform X2 [Myzus persicae]
MIQEMLNYSPKCQRKLKTNAVPTKPIVSYNILPQFIVQNQKVSPKNKSPWNVQEVYPGDLSNYNGQQIIITSPGFSVSDINPGNVEENNLVLNLNEGAKSSNQQSYGRPDNVIETELKESDINIKNNTCKRSLFNEHFNDFIPLPKSPEKEFTEQSDSFKYKN